MNLTNRYESQPKNNILGNFQVVLLEKFLSRDNELPFFVRIVRKLYFYNKEVSLSEGKAFGFEESKVQVEKFPLTVAPVNKLRLKRMYLDEEE